MARKKISRTSFSLSGKQAREFLAACMDDDRLKKELENEHLAPEMRAAIVAEALSRDLIAGNYQI
jgi:hypothetical protein